jgi:hypothetical protein
MTTRPFDRTGAADRNVYGCLQRAANAAAICAGLLTISVRLAWRSRKAREPGNGRDVLT